MTVPLGSLGGPTGERRTDTLGPEVGRLRSPTLQTSPVYPYGRWCRSGTELHTGPCRKIPAPTSPDRRLMHLVSAESDPSVFRSGVKDSVLETGGSTG